MDKKTKENARRLDELLVPMMHLMHRFTTQMSRCEDLTLAQHRVLMMVCHSGPMTINQLKESLSVAQSTASEMVERLVRQGWIKRDKAPEDRRITVFSLTAKADRFLKDKRIERIKVHKKILKPLSEKEQQKFLESFEMLLNRHKTPGINFDVKECYGKGKK
jgi:DNA-binding MarR family transcriptional regulator